MTTTKTSNSKKHTIKKSVSEDLISSKAHEIYLKRIKHGLPGDSDSDWILAEKELKK